MNTFNGSNFISIFDLISLNFYIKIKLTLHTTVGKSNLTLIVDGNWLLMSRLSVIQNRYADDDDLMYNLQLLITASIKNVLKTFPEIDNIVFVADNGSWRTKLPIPGFMKHDELGAEVEYKGTRIKGDDINWKLLFASYDNYISLLSQSGITVSKEEDVEGDDWCYWWSTYLNSIGTNCMIWSKDNDLKQLVRMNDDGVFTVWWNKDNGIYCKEVDTDNMSILFNINYDSNDKIFNDMCYHSVSVNKINPSQIIVDKILKGDVSDNIQPVLVRSTSQGTRNYKISSKDIDYDMNIQNDSVVKTFFEGLLKNKRYIGKVNKSLDEIMEHFEYNKRLVLLDNTSYPEDIKAIFEKHKDVHMSKNIELVEQQLKGQQSKITGILDLI